MRRRDGQKVKEGEPEERSLGSPCSKRRGAGSNGHDDKKESAVRV